MSIEISFVLSFRLRMGRPFICHNLNWPVFLFFYDSYFSRTSIVPTDLSLEFDIQRDESFYFGTSQRSIIIWLLR